MFEFIGMLVASNLIPIIMILFGYKLRYKTPAKGSMYAIKNKYTLKSDQAWIIGNRLCGLIWLIAGPVLMLICIATLAIYYNTESLRIVGMINVIVQLIAFCLSTIPVNIKVKNL